MIGSPAAAESLVVVNKNYMSRSTIVSVAVHRKRIDPTKSSSFVPRATLSSRNRTHVPFVEDASLSTKPPFPTSYVIVACSFDTDESTPTGVPSTSRENAIT